MLAAAIRLKKNHGRAWLVVGGLASVAWGVLLVVFPIPGLLVLTWWLGAYALVFGVSLLALGWTLHARRPRDGVRNGAAGLKTRTASAENSSAPGAPWPSPP